MLIFFFKKKRVDLNYNETPHIFYILIFNSNTQTASKLIEYGDLIYYGDFMICNPESKENKKL